MRSLFMCLLVLLAVPALASFEIDQATFPPGCGCCPALAVSLDHWTALAYVTEQPGLPDPQVAVRLIPTDPHTDEVWPDPVYFGPGRLPTICWSRDGFTLAYVDGDTVRTFQSDPSGGWYPEPTDAFVAGQVTGLDLWGAPTDAAGHPVFLTIDDDTDPSYTYQYRVRFASWSPYYGWSDLHVLSANQETRPSAQVTWAIGPAGPWPAVYYLAGAEWEPDLLYTYRGESGWTAPVVIPGDGGSGPTPFQSDFDVTRSRDMGILGLGPQPVCPCGSVHFMRTDDGQWQPQQNVTVNHEYYDWPFSPRLDSGWDGVIHAFWMQLGSAPDMTPHSSRLEYWIRDDDAWIDRGQFLDHLWQGISSCVDIGVTPDGERAVMAWSQVDTVQGVPQPEEIWVARSYTLADAPADPTPRPAVALTAWPNPFNPRVNLAVTLTAGGTATLDVYDARGRHVSRVHRGTLDAGRHEFTWNGTRDRGGRAPSGVYFARVVTDRGEAARKLVLTE